MFPALCAAFISCKAASRRFRIATHRLSKFHSRIGSKIKFSDTKFIFFQPPILRYLLEDLASKLRVILAPRKRASFLPTAQKSSISQTTFSQFTPIEVVVQIKEIFPALCTHLQMVTQKLIEQEEVEEKVRLSIVASILEIPSIHDSF